MSMNKIVLILLVMSTISIVGAQEGVNDINALMVAHDLNGDGIVTLSISDNEGGAILVHYDIYAGEYTYRPQQTTQTSDAQAPQVPGLPAIAVLLIIGSLYCVYRGSKQ